VPAIGPESQKKAPATMHPQPSSAYSPGRERFQNLVSSGVISPRRWIDSVENDHHLYLVGENKEAVGCLDAIRSIVIRVSKRQDPPWTAFSLGGEVRYKLSSDARRLWHVMRSVHLVHKAWGREGEMHPYVALGLRLFRKWEARLRWFTNAHAELMISDEFPRRAIRHVFRVIRRVCSSKRFVCRVRQLGRQHRDNFEGCAKYVLSILRDHARPLMIRADLYFEAEAKWAARDGKVERAIDKLIRNLRERRIIPNVLGSIVKLENAYDRGIHLHAMVFVDGNLHANAFGLTEMLISYWIHECVGSPEFASGFNCYRRKDEYLFNGLGHVHYADDHALKGVRDALRYLTKTDGHFFLPCEFGKSLRRGIIKSHMVDGRRRGAPRRHTEHLQLARDILLGQ
jgi:hypothetical protein